MTRMHRLGLLFGMMLSVASVQPAMAISTPMNSSNVVIDIDSSNPSWSQVHSASPRSCGWYASYCLGNGVIRPLSGSLNAVLNTNGRTSLMNINGTLTRGRDTLTILGGQLTSYNRRGHARGFLDYRLTGRLNQSGRFHFLTRHNYLTDNRFQLWGNNWDASNGERLYHAYRDRSRTPLGLDLRGVFRTEPVPTPEPSTMLLLGTGLLALPFLRKKSQQV